MSSSSSSSSSSPSGSEHVEHWSLVPRAGLDVLSRSFAFPDWKTALAFVNDVGGVADAHDHHPLVELTWGRVTLFVWTHDESRVGPRDTALCTAINALVR